MTLSEYPNFMQDNKNAIEFETSLTLARNSFHTYATMRNMGGEKSKPLTELAKSENLQLQVIELDIDIANAYQETATDKQELKTC
jgi:hypothetical protein